MQPKLKSGSMFFFFNTHLLITYNGSLSQQWVNPTCSTTDVFLVVFGWRAGTHHHTNPPNLLDACLDGLTLAMGLDVKYWTKYYRKHNPIMSHRDSCWGETTGFKVRLGRFGSWLPTFLLCGLAPILCASVSSSTRCGIITMSTHLGC